MLNRPVIIHPNPFTGVSPFYLPFLFGNNAVMNVGYPLIKATQGVNLSQKISIYMVQSLKGILHNLAAKKLSC